MTRQECLIERFALQCMEIWGGSHAATARTSTPGLDIWVSSRPHEGAEHGGDIHYVTSCASGRNHAPDRRRRQRPRCARRQGRRFPPPALMGRHSNYIDQTRLVEAVNREFGENRRGRRRRDVRHRRLRHLLRTDGDHVSNAGHPRPLWYDAATGDWEIVRTDDGPGRCSGEFAARDRSRPLRTRSGSCRLDFGDLIVLYTDALIETTDAAGKQLQEAGLLDLVRGLDATRPEQFGDALLARLDDYRGNRPADDDQTVVVLHHNAGHPHRLSLLESLTVYAKVFRLKSV